MSSVSDIKEKVIEIHEAMGLNPLQFTRIERMLFFAVVSECERCIRSEGMDCFESSRRVDCPFSNIREEYGISDVEIWKEMVK